MPQNPNKTALLRHLAASGDVVAGALVNGASDLTLSAGTESSNTIKVTGQVMDGAKTVVVESFPVSGAGTMTDGGAGSLKAGSGTKKVWLTPDASGKFELNVLNAVAEANLIIATSSNGDVTMLELTFA